ncbi:hypothetical protein KBJ98_00500 [Flavobacterium sp. F-328]|jgi:hypothetical protein|uniref:Uncharacterized protein n=1 Tax=Flavobacterium erciyesense TaxID=2825842 RepID=A0ABS5CZI8_9FLAO|nr:hypothetical protein [Flavobacterium erciyesense]MBQ0907177.1 hypothetical protein [Flavobacterium erciyesense]
MDVEKNKSENSKAEEPSIGYETSKIRFKGIDRATFNFDEEVKKGLTPEQAKAESIKRIREWWAK